MTNTVNLSKLNTYAVELRTPPVKTSKLNTYALELVDYGSLYQDVNASRPSYVEATTNTLAHIDQSGTSESLKVRVPLSSYYTFIVYKEDQTFSVEEYELTKGENTFPVTSNFNQVFMLEGRKGNIHRFTIEAIKEGMKARV